METSLSPDLQQNLIITAYLLFSHNYIAFIYLIGFLISTLLSIIKPSRFAILNLLGFLILLFSYEYDKHIIVGLREQTLNSLITETPHYKLEKVVNLIISQGLPIFFYILGWFLIFIAIVYAAFKLTKKN